MNWFVNVINGAIQGLADIGHAALEILPISPFLAWQNVLDNDLLGMLNWFVPIGDMIVILEAWGIAIGLWYLAMIVLRWVKIIE